MKVAIIGAGVSGLSCAFELKKHGITPTVFEMKSFIGDVLSYAGVWTKTITAPYGDPITYLYKNFGLNLKPLYLIKELNLIAPQKSAGIRKIQGYIFKRGQEEYSLENQIASLAQVPIQFDNFIEIEKIKNSFDYIVVSEGKNFVAKELNVWTDTFTSLNRVATVLGNFKEGSVTLWLNTRYAQNAFCYLVPISSKEASLVQIVSGITHHELETYWNEFLSRENIPFEVIETKDSEHTCGFVNPKRVGNIYFVGNSGGFTDDLIGVGGFNAIVSGIQAARSMVFGLNYDTLVQPIFKDLAKLHQIRKAVNHFDNPRLDKLVSFLGTPLVKQCTYNNPLFKVRYLSPAAKLYNMLKGGPK